MSCRRGSPARSLLLGGERLSTIDSLLKVMLTTLRAVGNHGQPRHHETGTLFAGAGDGKGGGKSRSIWSSSRQRRGLAPAPRLSGSAARSGRGSGESRDQRPRGSYLSPRAATALLASLCRQHCNTGSAADGATVRTAARQQLVQDHAERVDVGALIDRHRAPPEGRRRVLGPM